jgi:HEPN domain-containing protein
MDIEDIAEWINLADNDFGSAKMLNESVCKYYEIICYHCAQAVEKYLKGYLTFKDVIPEKTHNLLFLNNLCIEKDNVFENIKIECGFINRFANGIRYPHKYEVHEEDVSFSIAAVEKIRNIKPMSDLRTTIMAENNKENDTDKQPD